MFYSIAYFHAINYNLICTVMMIINVVFEDFNFSIVDGVSFQIVLFVGTLHSNILPLFQK